MTPSFYLLGVIFYIEVQLVCNVVLVSGIQPCGSYICTTVYMCMHVCLLSCFSHVWLFATPWTVAHQAPLSMRFSRQEYWSGLPCPLQGICVYVCTHILDIPGGSDGKIICLQHGRPGFNPCVEPEDPLEKEMATHSSTLAWKIPWMEKIGRLQSMASQRVRHDWVTSLSLSYTYIEIHTHTHMHIRIYSIF